MSPSGVERHYKDIISVCMRLLHDLSEATLLNSEYLLCNLARECASPYSFIIRIPASANRKAELVAFDSLLKQHERVSEKTAQLSKKVRLLRRTSFLAYAPLCRLSTWRRH